VTHGGHGTVIASLAHGVPIVTLPNPLVADQVPLARQVERLGAGMVLDGDAAPPEDIAAAVDEVLTDSRYRSSAERLATIINRTDGAATAADLVQRLAERQCGSA
jgi:UDP:flavonoid glycosyltransferase YjiC (YdhE family)